MRKFLIALLLSAGMITSAMAAKKPTQKPVQPQKQEEALKTGNQQYWAWCLSSKEYSDLVKKDGLRPAIVGNHPMSGNYIMVLTDLEGKVATVAEIQADGKTVCILTFIGEYGVDFLAFKPKHPQGEEREAVE